MGAKILLSAVAAGIAMGLLMAPEKGADARKRVNEGLDKLKEKWDELKGVKNISKDDLKELKEIFMKNVEGLSDDVRKKILQILESTKSAQEEMKAEPA